MRYAITPSLSTTVTLKNSTSKNQGQSDNPNSIYLDLDEEKGMKAGNLSSTLEKLYIWEKKLLDEVKVHCLLLLDRFNIPLPSPLRFIAYCFSSMLFAKNHMTV